MFTKRRKVTRQEKAENQRIWDENAKRFDKSMENMIKSAEIIEKEHPEFESLSEYERVKLFVETFKKVIDVNLTGTFIVSKYVGEILKNQGYGSI